MKYLSYSLSILSLIILQNSVYAEPVTHTHNGRTHTHPLPATGLNHSHIPNPANVPSPVPRTWRRAPAPPPANTPPANTSFPTFPPVHVIPFCNVKGLLLSENKFMGEYHKDHGGMNGPELTPIREVGLRNLTSNETQYKRFNFNPSSRKNYTDHRIGKSYHAVWYTFKNIPKGSYTVSLGQWPIEPRKVTFNCPNSRGHNDFEVRPIKVIGILRDG